MSGLLNFVPGHIAEALKRGVRVVLAELREVTTMFMKWDGFSSGRYTDGGSLQKCFFLAQEVLFEGGGYLRQFLVDDKGCVLIAVWGVAEANHVDNALRALWAAVTIRARLQSLGMGTSAGLATGSCYCGAVGSSLRQEYSVIGDSVNLAARLMCKAQGGVLLDQQSFSRLPFPLLERVAPLAKMALKGRVEPVQAYGYMSEDGFPLDIDEGGVDVPLSQQCRLAFDQIIAYLNDARKLSVPLLTSPVEPRVRFVLVESPMGPGLHHAVSALKHSAADCSQFRVVAVQLNKFDLSIPLGTLKKAFRELLRPSVYDLPNKQAAVVEKLLLEAFPNDAHHRDNVVFAAMRQYFGVASRSTNRSNKYLIRRTSLKLSSDGGPEDAAKHLADVIAALFRQERTLLIMENVEFMDKCTWDAMKLLCGREVRAAVVLTRRLFPGSRSELTSRAVNLSLSCRAMSVDRLQSHFDFLRHRPSSIYVNLSAYTQADAKAYLARQLRTLPAFLPSGLDALVHQLSAGDPFWLHEICEYIDSCGGAKAFMSAMGESSSSSSSGGGGQEAEDRTARTRSQRFGAVISSKTFLDESFGSLREASSRSDAISSAGDAARSARTPLLFLPPAPKVQTKSMSMSAFVLARFAKLSPEAQSVAKLCSIAGMEFSRDWVRCIAPEGLVDLLDRLLAGLVSGHWITDDDALSGTEPSYIFTHPTIHSAIYELTPWSAKRPLHTAIAQHLDALPLVSADQYFGLAFHYFLSSSNSVKIFQYLCLEAENLLRSGDCGLLESVVLMEEAMRLPAHTEDASALLGLVFLAKEQLYQQRQRQEIKSSRRETFMESVWQSSASQKEDQRRATGRLLDCMERQLVERERLLLPAGAAAEWQTLLIQRRQQGAPTVASAALPKTSSAVCALS